MTKWKEGDPDRRKDDPGRRRGDFATCPVHDIKCQAIEKNSIHIEEIFGKMVTKEDFKEMKDSVNKMAPKWVLILLVGLIVASFGWVATRMETKFETLHTIKANQDILLKAFHIKPVQNGD